jgi:hypothetical protein
LTLGECGRLMVLSLSFRVICVAVASNMTDK